MESASSPFLVGPRLASSGATEDVATRAGAEDRIGAIPHRCQNRDQGPSSVPDSELDECIKDAWGCAKSRPLDPGTYTVRGTFKHARDGSRAVAEATFEIQPSRWPLDGGLDPGPRPTWHRHRNQQLEGCPQLDPEIRTPRIRRADVTGSGTRDADAELGGRARRARPRRSRR